MGVGFRKSFLGFNCDDVLKYIENTHKDYSSKEKALNSKYNDLESKYNELKLKLDELIAQKQELTDQLNVYKDKEADIERLSEGIGKLYLVSKTSAKSIVSNATESSKITFEQINKNLDAIDSAHNIFNDAKEKANDAAQCFSEQIGELADELDAAKTKIKDNSENNQKVTASFDAFVNNN